MVKTRVHDLAAEFGVPAEQLMAFLSELTDDDASEENRTPA